MLWYLDVHGDVTLRLGESKAGQPLFTILMECSIHSQNQRVFINQ